MTTLALPPGVIDDKAPHILPFILSLRSGQLFTRSTTTSPSSPNQPLIIGLSACQGAGKSVLVNILQKALTEDYDMPTCVFSLDDFYLPHEGLKRLAEENPNNPLLQHRGQPGTHDVELASKVFKDLKAGMETRIPVFDKSLFQGEGDRLPSEEWVVINSDGKGKKEKKIEVILFEGWCVGFRALQKEKLEQMWKGAVQAVHADEREDASRYTGRLGHNTLESVSTINNHLSKYDELTSQFDGLVHIDAQDPLLVYKWRLEQEHGLIKVRGSGMTDAQVKNFIDGYFPSYELYVQNLRLGLFEKRGESHDSLKDDWKDRQLRLVVDANRQVVEVVTI